MKDGRTHPAHKAEHAADLESGTVVGVTVQDANADDTTTMVQTLITAPEQVEAALAAGGGVAELVAQKAYHSNETMVALAKLGLRSYVSEPVRGRRHWRGELAAPDAVYANRRRRPPRGRRLQLLRGPCLEPPHAHLCETGRRRWVHLPGHANIRKRLLVHACGLNLGLLMRQVTGVGTPRSLQGRARALFDPLRRAPRRFWSLASRSEALRPLRPLHSAPIASTASRHQRLPLALQVSRCPTGC